ncbi:MAG: hypothetical protein AAGJ85_03815 [Pseudomonadota bacterium]
MANVETQLLDEKNNFEFVSCREPSANGGNGETIQLFRFRDDDAVPKLIIQASKDFFDKSFCKDLLNMFISSIPEDQNSYEFLSEGWKNCVRHVDIYQHQYFLGEYKMIFRYDSSLDIKALKAEALSILPNIEA